MKECIKPNLCNVVYLFLMKGLDWMFEGIRMTSTTPVTADDVIGERIHPQEEAFLQSEILNIMVGPQRRFSRFPGAQPVSMDRGNIEMLAKKRYWVTYKADGTRYMLLLMRHGAFVVNRDFEFQRVEMRFPFEFRKDGLVANPGLPHDMTLLDGEMVVDHDKESNRYTRKFLIYDLVIHHGESWMNLPWKQRFGRVEGIVNLRNSERRKIEMHQWPFDYQYSLEPFQVEAKMFRCMGQVEALIKAIPRLAHECDGFIFQAYEDKYRIGTHEELLKWKYAHMNSVDFRYRHQPHSKDDGQVFLMSGNEVECKNTKVVFETEADKVRYNGKIIECTYDGKHDQWKFLRERVDKKHPNAFTVYEKVFQSIRDNITQQELVNRMLELFSESDLYAKDREKLEACDSAHL